jgi:hypothetical protein
MMPPCIQHGPPATVLHDVDAGGPSSSQLNLLDTLTVTTRKIKTRTREQPTPATSKTDTNRHVVIENDGQQSVVLVAALVLVVSSASEASVINPTLACCRIPSMCEGSW